MQIILLHDVNKLGSRGETVNVAPGFARNFLFPQGLAVHADTSHQRELQTQLRSLAARDDRDRKVAEDRAGTMGDVSIKFSAAAGDEDKLYGSVTAQMIAAALVEKGHQISARQIELEEPLKKLGNYSVPVRLHTNVRVEIPVWIERS